MYTIFHNSRCSKSRQGLEIVKNSGVEYKVREYLKEGQELKFSELQKILELLSTQGGKISDMIRVKEKFWKEENIDIKTLLQNNIPENNKKILECIVKFPRGFERPILVKNNELVVIGRPPENFLEAL